MALISDSLSGRRRTQRVGSQSGEPDYVRTRSDDGRKYVEPNEFIKDPRVQRQIRRLAKEAYGG